MSSKFRQRIQLKANTVLNNTYYQAAHSSLPSINLVLVKSHSRACRQALRKNHLSFTSLIPSRRALHQSLCTQAFKRRFVGQQTPIWAWDCSCLIMRFSIDMPWFVRPKLKYLITVKALFQNLDRWVTWRSRCLQKMEAQQMPWERLWRISLTMPS